MIGFLTANGKSSRDFNVYLSDAGVYGLAERDVETVSVPGRSGDLLIDKNRYKNVTFTYPAIIRDNFDVNFSTFIGYLLRQTGYIKLKDSFHPNEYVLGKYVGETNPKRVSRDVLGTFELTFNRKPQRFMDDGELAITLTSNGSIYSEYLTTALPLVRVYGTGDVSIGANTITIIGANGYTDIDCDTQNAFKETTNCNGNIRLGSGEFFSLVPGMNNVVLGRGISRVDITPRWWRL